MKKAIYVTPVIEIHRIEPPVIMAGSGEQNNISIGVEDDPNDLSKKHSVLNKPRRVCGIKMNK